MMRLIPVCLPLVLAPLLVAGQQAQSTTASKPEQASTVKQPSANAPQNTAKGSKGRRAAHKRHSRKHKGAKRAQYRPDYHENSVQVINGDATKQVVFHDDKAEAAPKRNVRASSKKAPAPMKVEVLNGTSTDTQYFYDNGQNQQETARNQAVVVGVQSSDTRTAGGNKNPVVTGVTSSGTGYAKSASSGGQPVAKQVSPRPKRPAYQQDVH
jgi:hypothetical protein